MFKTTVSERCNLGAGHVHIFIESAVIIETGCGGWCGSVGS